MQTLTIGAYRATLAPTRDVGAFHAKLAKCNGKSRKSAIRDTRTKGKFPKFEAGMSTADYVRLFESLGTPCKPVEWAQLNSEPCTLYSGEDTCETLPDGFDTWEDFDAAQGSSAAAESAPANAEPDDAAEPVAPDDAIAPAIVASAEPYPGCEPAAAIVYRVHLATAAHSRAIDPAFNGYRRPRSACMLADFAAPAVRAHRLAIARSVRAERAKRASLDGSEPQRMADAMRARIAPTDDALREAAAELEARAARVPTERADDYRGAAAMLRADADAAPGIVPGFASRGARMLQAAIARSAARGIEVGAGGAPLATHSQTAPVADPLATHSALVAEINAMSPVDAFDYLADYTTAGERHMTDAEKAPDAMRAAVLADVERTGEAVFWARRRGEPDDDGPTASPPATHSDPVPSADPPPADSQDAPDVAKWRAELRSVEDAILRAAPARYSNGRYGCDIEAAARSRSVAADLKRQRKYLRASLRGARMMADAVQPAPVASAPPPVESRPLTPAAERTFATDEADERASVRPWPDPLPVESAPLPGDTKPEVPEDDETIPAPLDGLDVAELDDMAEFERAGGIAQPIAPAYRDDAPRATPTPSLRISPSDPRARIPARFAPVYLLQA